MPRQSHRGQRKSADKDTTMPRHSKKNAGEYEGNSYFWASEPPMMSSNSLVMACWRLLLY